MDVQLLFYESFTVAISSRGIGNSLSFVNLSVHIETAGDETIFGCYDRLFSAAGTGSFLLSTDFLTPSIHSIQIWLDDFILTTFEMLPHGRMLLDNNDVFFHCCFGVVTMRQS